MIKHASAHCTLFFAAVSHILSLGFCLYVHMLWLMIIFYRLSYCMGDKVSFKVLMPPCLIRGKPILPTWTVLTYLDSLTLTHNTLAFFSNQISPLIRAVPILWSPSNYSSLTPTCSPMPETLADINYIMLPQATPYTLVSFPTPTEDRAFCPTLACSKL